MESLSSFDRGASDGPAVPRRDRDVGSIASGHRSKQPLLRRWLREWLPPGSDLEPGFSDLLEETFRHCLAREAASRQGSFVVEVRDRLLRAMARTASPPQCASGRVERVVGRHHLDRYEAAVAALPPRLRELLILRVEFGFEYAAIAEEVDSTVAAARNGTLDALTALADAIAVTSRTKLAHPQRGAR